MSRFSSKLAAICAWLGFTVASSYGVPVAVDDAFTTAEDAPLTSSVTTLFTGDFEPVTAVNVLTGNWDFLDKIQNQLGTPASQTYPLDGAGRDWKSINYAVGTSTIGPWGSNAMPIQYGGLTGIPGAANVISASVVNTGAGNPVTTVLYRKVFNLTATEAAQTSWNLNYLLDDGMVVYLNGTEIARVNMPTGTVTPDTLASVAGDEVNYANLPITLPGSLLVTGQNVMAIELHQNATSSSDIGLDVTFSQGGAVNDGFTGVTKAFGTNPIPTGGSQGTIESTALSTTAGFGGGGAVTLDIGYRPFRGAPMTPTTRASSAAWTKPFSLATAATVQVSFRHRVVLNGSMTASEYGEVILDIDGTKYGSVPANSGNYPAGWKNIRRTNGTGAATVDSGWFQYTTDIPLAAGAHTLKLGVFNNESGQGSRHVQGYFDDIVFSIPSTTGGVLGNDTGGATSAVLVTGTSHGALTLSPDGTISYIPDPNFHGTDSFTYRASDGTTQSVDPATATITVTPVNDAPAAIGDAYNIDEDGTLTRNAAGGLLANDTDIDGDTLTAVLDANVANGTLTLNSDGSFTYVPNPNFSGDDFFTYHARDGALNSAITTVNITVNPIDDAPIAVADSYSMLKNTTLTITNPNGTVVTDEIISSAVRDGANAITTPGSLWKYWDQGSLPVGNWKALSYDDSNWLEGASELGFGDSFDTPSWPEATVIADDGVPGYTEPPAGNRYTAYYFRKIVNIPNVSEVTAVDLRVMRDDGAIIYFNGTPAYRNHLIADPLYTTTATNTITEKTFHNAATLGATGEANNWLNVAPTPALLVEGNNIFAAEVHQSTLTSSDVSFDVKLTITRFSNYGLLKNDSDPEGSPLTAILVTNPAHGSVTVNTDGTFSYTPTPGYVGTDSFTYKANDGTQDSNIATATIIITNSTANGKPTAVNDTYTATEDTLLTVPSASGVLLNDTDPENDPLTSILVSNVTKGTLALAPDGSFTYTPNANVTGVDSFTYKCRDSQNADSTTSATVTINITPVNDPPAAVNDSYAVDPGGTLNIAAPGVLGNDTDIDTLAANLTAQLVSGPSGGTLTLNANGSFTFSSASAGVFTFTYKVNDGDLDSASAATVTITVNGIPVAGPNSYTLNEDAPLTVNAPGLLANDSDPENSPLTAIKVTNPAHGTVTVDANGSFTYTPTANFFGADSFTYKVNDGSRDSVPATVSLTVTNVDDAPIAVNDAYVAIPNATLTVAVAQGVLANDSDPDGNSLSANLVADVQHGTLTFSANGSFTYIPTLDYNGTDTFTYTVTDGIYTSSTATVTITIADGGSNVVINEIMFRPGNTYPENPQREFIELYNRGTTSVDLTNWQISSGVAYVFPANTILPAGEYLAVASNVPAFQAAYPTVTNVIGGWVGTLANSGEKIKLKDAFGNDRDSVTYSSEGDWAQRIRETTYGGWDWSPLTNGGGRSLELRNPNVSNENGQNWQPSAVAGGTPGRVNAAFTTNIPPIIKAVKHYPAVPKSTDTVLVSCELNDESNIPALTATLYWRNATTTSPPAFTALAMSTDGNGGWFAPLPAQANLTIIEFYISATDGVLTRTWPAPNAEGQTTNCQYQVSDEADSTSAEMIRMVLTATENAAYNGVSQSSNRQFNQTMIVTRGPETSIRYGCSMRIRGNGSRSYQFKPLRISIPSDDPLDGKTSFNLNPKASHLQYLGMHCFQVLGLRCANAMPVEVRRNGVEYTTSIGSTPDFGAWVKMEDLNGEFIGDHWPVGTEGNGAIYKKGRPDYYFRATQAAPTNPDSLLDGWSKQNNGAANDWSDLRNLLSVWQTNAQPHFTAATTNDVAESGGSSTTGIGKWDGTAFTTQEVTNLETVADLDQWARWLAVMTVLLDKETNISNGQDDDYSMYFMPTTVSGTPRLLAQLVPHDLDTIFGLGDTATAYNAVGLYDATNNSDVFRPLLPLLGDSTTTGNAAFRTKYFDALKLILGSVFDADTTNNAYPPFYAFVDYHLGNWAPDATRTAIKDFVRQRRSYLLGLMSATATAPAAPTSNATVTSTHGDLVIHEVLASNLNAYANAGLYPDVIEIRNTGATTIDLGGKSLTDDPLVKAKYVFPLNTQLTAGSILIVFADSATTAPGLHTGFGLDADGDALYLYDTVGSGQGLLDSVVFGLQVPNFTIGRTGATLEEWTLCIPTIGADNTAVASLASPSVLKINEWLGNADYRVPNDFVELYNPATQPVALGGMAITDDQINYPTRATLPPLSFMGASSFVAFDAVETDATPGNARELPFSLSSSYGSVFVFGANGALVDRVDTVSQFRDGAVGRLPDGSVSLTRLSLPSPGASNAPLPEESLDLLNYLRITEMMYNPANSGQSEYLELRNMSDKPLAPAVTAVPVTLDLSGVYFANGITYTFPPATTLAPGATIVLVGDATKFSAQFPSITVGGVYTGKLDNNGERIRLNVPSGAVSILDFKYSNDWYPSTDGGGSALQIVDATAAIAMWDKQEGWQADPPSPGADPAFSVAAGLDKSIPMGTPLFLDGSVNRGAALPQDITVAWTTDSGPGTVTFTTGAYQDANAVFSAPGIYVLRFTATSTTPAASAFDTTTVTVTETYANWASRKLTGGNSSYQAKTDDPDHDGISNLIEYITDGNPALPDQPVQMELTNGILSIRYNRSKMADPAIQLVPQFSVGLDSWMDESTGPEVTKILESQTTAVETWKAQADLPSNHVFARLLVVDPAAP